MPPSALEIAAGDFALAGGMAVSPSASWPATLKSRPPQILPRDDGRLNTVK
jgi:hypothetical protein